MCVLFYLYVLMIGNNSQIYERNKNYIGSSLGELSKSVTLQEIHSFKKKKIKVSKHKVQESFKL